MRPLIGVTPDEGLTTVRPGRPALRRYELKAAYPEAVSAAGGLPLVLPYMEDEASLTQYLGVIQGLVVTGGAFDIPAEEYGATPHPKLGAVNVARTRFERRLLEGALARGLPVLGVCGGMQLLNVVQGGTLIQDIQSELPEVRSHEQSHDPREPAHFVALTIGSVLARACGATEAPANTTHHQAIRDLGRDLRVTGSTPDGIIEGIEGTGSGFVLGVQWHPELLQDKANRGIYRALVEAAGG
jgi:putative glutamine amidotransferase